MRVLLSHGGCLSSPSVCLPRTDGQSQLRFDSSQDVHTFCSGKVLLGMLVPCHRRAVGKAAWLGDNNSLEQSCSSISFTVGPVCSLDPRLGLKVWSMGMLWGCPKPLQMSPESFKRSLNSNPSITSVFHTLPQPRISPARLSLCREITWGVGGECEAKTPSRP